MTAGPGRFGQPDVPEHPPPAGLFTRGYDRAGTDELVADLSARLAERTARLYTVERENRRLRAERTADAHAARVSEVEESISILTAAQENADQTIAEADEYRRSAIAEIERLRADARREADAILVGARARSQEVVDRIDAEAAERERQALRQHEVLRRQTEYLRSVRDAAGTQMLSFLNGVVDRVAAEFGAADPAAVPSGSPAPPGDPVSSGGPAGADRPATTTGGTPRPVTLPGLDPSVGLPARPAPAGRRIRRGREPRAHVRHLAGR